MDFPNPSNPRINDDSVPHVAASIRRFGWLQPLVVKLPGKIIAGNTRFKAAQKLGIDQVPVVRFTGTDLDAVAFGVADSRTHEFAKWDTPALAKLLRELRTGDALEGVGFSADEIDALIGEVNAGGGAVGEGVNDPSEQDPPNVVALRTGDLWPLGEHRLLCGERIRGARATPPRSPCSPPTRHPSELAALIALERSGEPRVHRRRPSSRRRVPGRTPIVRPPAPCSRSASSRWIDPP